MSIHPQYITDINGNKSMVILPVEEFDRIMEELEDFADIQLYDEAKKMIRASGYLWNKLLK